MAHLEMFQFQRLHIDPIWISPDATQRYGCLFGGDVQFFREPLYQSFFTFMDEKKGRTFGAGSCDVFGAVWRYP